MGHTHSRKHLIGRTQHKYRMSHENYKLKLAMSAMSDFLTIADYSLITIVSVCTTLRDNYKKLLNLDSRGTSKWYLNKVLAFKIAKFVPPFAFSVPVRKRSGAEFQFLTAEEPLPRQILHTIGANKEKPKAARLLGLTKNTTLQLTG